jgi:hypothetical protein
MALASARQPVLVLATMAMLVALASACIFDRGPLITCESVATVDCARALDMAGPLMRSYWDQASEVQVHPGRCSRYRHCLLTAQEPEGFITVDLVSADRSTMAFVVIDRRNADWTATCFRTVRDPNGGAHGESCSH